MQYEFYIDAFVMTNGLMDFLVLMFTDEILHRKARLGALFLASVLGAVVSAVFFLWMSDYLLYQMVIHFILNPLMLVFAFGEKKGKRLLEDWIISYLAMILLGGAMQWLYYGIGRGQHFVLCLLGVLTIGVFGLCVVERYRRIEGKVYEVKICQDDRELEVAAYYDSGNLLTDPYVKEPVQIIDEEMIRPLMEEKQMRKRLIPFHSLGKENGWIAVITAEKMIIRKRKEQIEVCPVVLGLGRKELFSGTGYHMLLNEKNLRG